MWQSTLIIVGITTFVILGIELAYYTLFIPDLSDKPIRHRLLDEHFGAAAYLIAQILSPIRLPLGIFPYLIKLFMFLTVKTGYKIQNNSYKRVAIHHLGDTVNLLFTAMLLVVVIGPFTFHSLTFLLYLPVIAEFVRLSTEHGQSAFSAAWQLIPHRRIALTIRSRQSSNRFYSWIAKRFTRYCYYYSLSDDERARHVLAVLKHRAKIDTYLSKRIEYIRAFRLFPQDRNLRAGMVRDVANGEVFVNILWTNDPWLLTGMAIRRSPWMFDPRYLQRPFYYRTVSARLASQFVLKHARYCPPFAIFQLGHEIRAARYSLLYKVLHWMGIHVEEYVREDGTYKFDQLICWLEKRLGRGKTDLDKRPLWTDDEVLVDVLGRLNAKEHVSALDIAMKYTYPLKYVEEVLIRKISAACSPNQLALLEAYQYVVTT